ncbi:MAG: hypothetical protein RSD48_02470 [Oscillospiraceae bacterium]
MTPMEILHKIVDTEYDARSIYSEAISQRDGFDAHVSEHISALKNEYFARADKEIATAEQREIRRADQAIQELDKRLSSELDAAKSRYESEKDEVILKIFKLAVDVDA